MHPIRALPRPRNRHAGSKIGTIEEGTLRGEMGESRKMENESNKWIPENEICLVLMGKQIYKWKILFTTGISYFPMGLSISQNPFI